MKNDNVDNTDSDDNDDNDNVTTPTNKNDIDITYNDTGKKKMR